MSVDVFQSMLTLIAKINVRLKNELYLNKAEATNKRLAFAVAISSRC